MILKGSEIIEGGSMTIPIDIRVLETTMSMIRNGRKIKKPIRNARLSSLVMNAGTTISKLRSVRSSGTVIRSSSGRRSLAIVRNIAASSV